MTKIEDTTPLHLRGNGRPITEERTLTQLKVTGSIPRELDGRYVRNGANPKSGFSAHPFFGDGMVHDVRLCDGKATWYRNRYVQTPFITNPSLDILDPAVAVDMKASKANTHVVGHAGKILALEEGHFPYVLDGNLETVGPTDFGGVLKGSFTAHPKICPVTGEMLAFGYSGMPPYLRYLRVSADGKLVQTENITVGGPTMMHDFNITRNFVIFMERERQATEAQISGLRACLAAKLEELKQAIAQATQAEDVSAQNRHDMESRRGGRNGKLTTMAGRTQLKP